MAREYGKVLMSAWNDRHFVTLSRRAQGTYFFLCSQSDLNRAGVITMALNRWASRCGENSREVILEDLAELARERYIVVDETEEEILVRSYIRNDEGWKSPNVMVAVVNAARQISSETHRAVICEELAKIDTSGLSVTINEKTGRSTKEFIEGVIADARSSLAQYEKNPSVMSYGTLTERVTETLKNEAETETLPERVSSGFLTETETSPETSTKTSPETSPPAAAGLPEGFEDFWDAYDKKQGRKEAIAKYRIAIRKRGVTPELLLNAATEYVGFLQSTGKHPEFTKNATTWLNGEHWNDERSARRPAVAASKPSTTDQRVRDGLAVAERLRAEEEQTPHLRAIGQNQ